MATAFYWGLRLGELLALQWGDVDLQARMVHVRRAYDAKCREYVTPKSRAGTKFGAICCCVESDRG